MKRKRMMSTGREMEAEEGGREGGGLEEEKRRRKIPQGQR